MLNRVQLIGRLGADPTVRYMPSGDPVCSFTLATSERWIDKSTGEKKQNTEWHNIVIFRGLAKIAGEYLKKGSQVYLEGKIKTRKWQDKDGADRYTTEIIAEEMHMLDGKKQEGGSPETQAQQQQTPASSGKAKMDYYGDEFSDDIPF